MNPTSLPSYVKPGTAPYTFAFTSDAQPPQDPEPAATPPAAPATLPTPRPSPDFRAVVWPHKGEMLLLTFTATQAAFVEILWEARRAGYKYVGMAYLIEHVCSSDRRSIASIFPNHRAIGTMIVADGPRGCWRIGDPS